MRDFPDFQTDYGLAGLVLNQIPYSGTAYIHIHSFTDIEALLNECISFCIACGASKVFAAGEDLEVVGVEPISVLIMQIEHSAVPDTDACLMPVTEESLDRWLEIYHDRMQGVDHSAYISRKEGLRIVSDGGGYFVHLEGELLGIGRVDCEKIDCIASAKKGSGQIVLSALCHAISTDTVCLEVASTNDPAIRLYERMGFITAGIKYKWFQVL